MFTFSQKNKKSGFSLIEMIIYISILAVVLVIVINTSLLMAKAYSGMKISHDISNSAVNIMERLTREIRWSDSVNVGGSVFSSDQGVLVLNTINELEESVEMRFSLEGGDLIMKEGVSSGEPLDLPGIVVKKFYLERSDLGISELIKIRLEIEGYHKDKVKTETFYNSVVTRESY